MRAHAVNAEPGWLSQWDSFKAWLHAGLAAGMEPMSNAARDDDKPFWAAGPADAAIRKALLAKLARQAWWHAEVSNLVVIDGSVIYQGLYYGADEKRAARSAAQGIKGVSEVRDDRVRASA